jgi:hypothetical protein
MLRRRSLHESTDVADSECQVRPHVDKVAKAATIRWYYVALTSLVVLSRLSFSLSSMGV